MSKITEQKKTYNKQITYFIFSAFISFLLIFSCFYVVYFFYNRSPNNIISAKNSDKNQKNKNQKAISVVVDSSKIANVPVYLSAIGTVISKNNIIVKTQINGKLQHIYFQEGQFIHTGDLLAQIDSKIYEAQLSQYQGQLLRDEALLSNARLDLKRYKLLYPGGSISKQIYDTQVSLVKQYEGTVKFDLGLVENAQVNLSYCQILSPITGRVGLRLVDEGNYIQTSDANGILAINSMNPIDVIFSIPEDNIPDVLEKLNSKKILDAEAYDRSLKKKIAKGKLLSLDNQIDQTTGTIKLKAEFDNSNGMLFPNQFVNIKLLVNTLENVVVVPIAAVQHRTEGAFVYEVDEFNKVHIQPVIEGYTEGFNTVLTSGLKANVKVVVEGIDKLYEGALVTSGKLP